MHNKDVFLRFSKYVKELCCQVDASTLDLIQVYQHIVLLVQYFGKYGAFGISRWPAFMSKDLKFDRLCIGCKILVLEDSHKAEMIMSFVKLLKSF